MPSETVAGPKDKGIEYIEGDAVFVDPDTVGVNGTFYKPRFTVIATGAIPMPLPIEDRENLATSNDFLDLETMPQRINLIGGVDWCP